MKIDCSRTLQTFDLYYEELRVICSILRGLVGDLQWFIEFVL